MNQKLFSENEVQVLEAIITSRRDVRGNSFLPTPINDLLLEQILFAAVSAPSVGFSQPWEFVVIRERSTREQVYNSFAEENAKATGQFSSEKGEKYQKLKLDGILESPVNIAVLYRPSEKAVLGQTSMKEVGLYSVVCAIQNMWLMSRALNIGMGWVSILDPEKVKAIIDAPGSRQLVAYLCLGYAEKFFEQPELEILQWEKRKMLNEVLHFEKYKEL